MTALWINNPGFDTDHRHRGGMLTKTPPLTGLQIPATVTTLTHSKQKTLNAGTSQAPFTRYNLLTNKLSNRFDNWLNVCIHDTTGCQTGLTISCIVYNVHVYKHSAGCQTSNRFDSRLAVSCIQPVVNRLYNPVWQPVERTVVVCLTRWTRLSNLFYNRFDNRLYRVNKHPTGCQTGYTGCIQPVVKPVVQPAWQLVVSCKRGIRANPAAFVHAWYWRADGDWRVGLWMTKLSFKFVIACNKLTT